MKITPAQARAYLEWCFNAAVPDVDRIRTINPCECRRASRDNHRGCPLCHADALPEPERSKWVSSIRARVEPLGAHDENA